MLANWKHYPSICLKGLSKTTKNLASKVGILAEI
jgi:hypothetical protein